MANDPVQLLIQYFFDLSLEYKLLIIGGAALYCYILTLLHPYCLVFIFVLPSVLKQLPIFFPELLDPREHPFFASFFSDEPAGVTDTTTNTTDTTNVHPNPKKKRRGRKEN